MTKILVDSELLPCPFCGGGTTEVVENGRVWTGMKYSDPISVSVRHWCEEAPGPNRMIERIGRDREQAIERWNTRAALDAPQQEAPTTDDRKDAERYRWLRKNSVFSWDKGDELALVVPGDTNSYNYEDDADVAIDAAMDAKKGEKK